MTLSSAEHLDRLENLLLDVRKNVGNYAYPEVAEGLWEQMESALNTVQLLRNELPGDAIVNRDKLARTLASGGPWTKKRWKELKLSTTPESVAVVAEAFERADAAIAAFTKSLKPGGRKNSGGEPDGQD